MCGRYTLTNPDPARIRARFGLDERARVEVPPRYNIAPTDPVLAIRRRGDGAREAGLLRWGLLPGRWAERGGRPLINARAESLARQPAFAESFRERRCLIPADGFYEWRRDGSGKTPVWVSQADGDLYAFAGIWAALPARGGGEAVHSCAIVTCPPNELLRPVHYRMPVILAPETEELWLSPDLSADELLRLLAPAPDGVLTLREVGDYVNDVRQDGPHLIEPRQRQATLIQPAGGA